MPTDIAEQPTTTELAVIEAFEITKQQITEAVSLADKATVAGPEDKDGMKLAHDYRMGLTKMRTGIDKKRRQLKADEATLAEIERRAAYESPVARAAIRGPIERRRKELSK